MNSLLEQAQGALKRRNPERALKLLLTAWRKKRAPSLADLIDSVSEACAARMEPLPRRLAIDDFGAWRELCAKRNPEDFDRLVAVQLPKTGGDVREMVYAFSWWAHDPRVARFCSRLLLDQVIFSKGRDAKRSSNTHADTYEYIARQLVLLRDARSADALASMSFVPKDFPWLKAREAEAFGRVRVKLTTTEARLVEALSAGFPKRHSAVRLETKSRSSPGSRLAT